MHRTPNPAAWVTPLLDKLPSVSITVFGDFCLDAYWLLNTSGPEISIETGLPLQRVETQRYSLGGAGSVVANLAAMGTGTIRAIGVLGDDLFGDKLLALLAECKVDASAMLREQSLQTMVYAKPLSDGAEHSRIDFGGFNSYSAPLIDAVLEALDHAFATSDVVVLNQQVPRSISSPEVIRRINRIIAAHPQTICVVDSRHHAECYSGAILKLNTHEAARVLGEKQSADYSGVQAQDFASRIQDMTSHPVFVTRGDRGLTAAASNGAITSIPGLQVNGLVDTVGAGDAVVAALSVALAAGETVAHAAELANIAGSITVGQLQCTGTASAQQIREAIVDLNYVFSPELAASPRLAHYVPGSEIEIASTLPDHIALKHCIFDHDGTLSVLREGWENIMEPLMLRAILGKLHDTVDAATFAQVQTAARHLISRTTGIQTLVQMRGLIELVRQSGFVDESEVLDEYGYKHQFNVELLKMIERRVEKLRTGELSSLDFQIKNAAVLLEALYNRGIKLYLASGTDQDDVIAEATALGYAHFFEGRIFGGVGDPTIEAKKIVLDSVIRENNLQGHEFAMFGDGPVEIRETQKRGGIAIGVASDELRRFGLSPFKRERLIRSGANLIVPDYSQLPALLNVLQIA